jgi:hypothetical protein
MVNPESASKFDSAGEADQSPTRTFHVWNYQANILSYQTATTTNGLRHTVPEKVLSHLNPKSGVNTAIDCH